MNENIMVSIICNAFNHEKYIRDALNGFIAQKTTFPFEVLIHDDASTDKTADIIREYECKYPQIIKPIYQIENQYSKDAGSIRSIQGGRTRGKYVALCEGDDYWTDSYKLQKQFDFMESHPEYTLCACGSQWLNMLNGKIWDRCYTNTDTDITLEEVLFPKTGGRDFVTASVFVKTEIWKNVPLWGFPIGDLPLAIYACLQGKVHMLADIMCVYRWHTAGSWTERMSKDSDRAIVCKKNIYALENLNRDTNYQYDNLIKKKILTYRYQEALMNHEFKSIQTSELLEIYQKKRLLNRLSDRLRCTEPNLHHLILIILGRKKI